MNSLTITSQEQYDAAIHAHRYIIADFYKDNCPACTMQDMALRKFAQMDMALYCILLKIQLERIGQPFFWQHGIRQTPTLLFLSNAKEVCALPGFRSPEQIDTIVQDAFGEILKHKSIVT